MTFKKGDRVRAKPGEYEGFVFGSSYNLPRGYGTVVESGPGFLRIEYAGRLSPPVAPVSFEVAEAAPTSPVREVIRLEVVAGSYGRLGTIGVGDATESRKVPVDLDRRFYDASDLREAARIFTQIADALDENMRAAA